MPNRLTPLYSKIYYKEENYLKVKTVVFKYITPPHNKGWVCGASVYQYILYFYIPIFPHSDSLVIYYLYDSATPHPMALLVLSVLYFTYWF